jgi:hypothetical protein
MLSLVCFALFGKHVKRGDIAWICVNPPLVGNVATSVVRGNISLTVNIVLSETVTEFSAVVRTQ